MAAGCLAAVASYGVGQQRSPLVVADGIRYDWIYETEFQPAGWYAVEADDEALTEVNIPAAVVVGGLTYNVTGVGPAAFRGNTALTRVTLPEGATVSDGAFSGCTSLTDVNFENIRSVMVDGFAGCTSLRTVCLTGLRELFPAAFDGCTGITDVTLGTRGEPLVFWFNYTRLNDNSNNDATQPCWNDDPFSGCTAIKSLTVNGDLKNVSADPSSARKTVPFNDVIDRVLDIHIFYALNGNSYPLAADATALTSLALYGDPGYDQSFINSHTRLEELTLPEHLISMDRMNLRAMTALRHITINEPWPPACPEEPFAEGVRPAVTVPDGFGAAYAKARVWRECAITEDATLPHEAVSPEALPMPLDFGAFTITDADAREVSQAMSPYFVRSGSWFDNHSEYATFFNSLNETFGTQPTVTDDGVEYRITGVSRYAGRGINRLMSITLDDNIRHIGDYAFMNAVLGIGTDELAVCDLGEGLESVGDGVMYDATATRPFTLRLPATLRSIGKGAFSITGERVDVRCDAMTPPVCTDGDVFGDKSQRSLTVPEEAAEAYRKAPVWREFGTINGVGAIDAVIADDTAAPVEYYNMQGIRIEHPDRGIYIRRQGSSVSKVSL